ncbi:TIGR01212 family radical SAM protein [Pyramidobacter sp. YE332]|uniref:TIGR01212 family radical SAM protein n=1 Tax=unclassified Pyramidobacter TaxID=2632171 RepID=UPI00098E9CB6|nr:MULTISPECIES: TIGR01212 family radical SAM protein [unclassified Pyramidobacter]OON88175.1 TIGR01212 family radical SAM protein [Pyramidobacter sp. C12-8]WOL41049.1 TIGR01212 family radical SAM protein [Pyramidobacter sp. YE332]
MKHLLRWSAVLRRQFGERVQKVSLDIGAGCPHRQGLRGGGCIFCDERGGGSGAFIQGISLREQVRRGIAGAWKHYGTRSIILYFQSYSATNLPLERFASALNEARDAAAALGANVRAISVSTRPDLLPEPVLNYLQELAENCQIWLELGVQTTDPQGLRWLRRGHGLDVVEQALARLSKTRVQTCAHLIAGIPGEREDQLTRSALWLAERGVQALKFHPLYVLRGTPLETLYAAGRFEPLSRKGYVGRLVEALWKLPDGIVLQRLTAGVRPAQLVAPQWILDKESLERQIAARFIFMPPRQNSVR